MGGIMIEFDTFEAEWKEDQSGSWISFRVHDRETAMKACQMPIESKAYVVTLKEKRIRRSLDQNAYFHLLANKIAEKVGSSDDEIKRDLVLKYGTIAKDAEDNIQAVMLPEYAEITPFYPYAKFIKTRKISKENGAETVYNCYILYKPTHTLDSKEMSRLIDGTVSEAKELGIETELPSDIKFTEG